MTRERIHCGLTAPVLKVGILAVLPRPRAAPTKFDQPWTTVKGIRATARETGGMPPP